MWVALLAFGLAQAEPGQVTLNGVDITEVREQQFRAVDVYIDEFGRVHITSDRYKVQIDDPVADSPASPPDRPIASDEATVQGRPARVAPRAGDETRAADAHPPDAPDRGTWWLATEDNGTTGHRVIVEVNGAQVATIESGDPQRIQDISAFLRRGSNRVTLRMSSAEPTGRTLFVYVGQGRNEGGTVRLGQPEIQHGLGPSRRGDLVREFELRVE